MEDIFDRTELGKSVDAFIYNNPEAKGADIIKHIAGEINARALSGQRVQIKNFLAARLVTVPARSGTAPGTGLPYHKPEHTRVKIKSLLPK